MEDFPVHNFQMTAQIIQMMAFIQIMAIWTPGITLQDHHKLTEHNPFTEKKSAAKMAPPWSCFGKWLNLLKVEPFFSLIIMFEKKTVPLTKVPLWSCFQPFFGRKRYHFAKWY